jgi:hypothetical protein
VLVVAVLTTNVATHTPFKADIPCAFEIVISDPGPPGFALSVGAGLSKTTTTGEPLVALMTFIAFSGTPDGAPLGEIFNNRD